MSAKGDEITDKIIEDLKALWGKFCELKNAGNLFENTSVKERLFVLVTVIWPLIASITMMITRKTIIMTMNQRILFVIIDFLPMLLLFSTFLWLVCDNLQNKIQPKQLLLFIVLLIEALVGGLLNKANDEAKFINIYLLQPISLPLALIALSAVLLLIFNGNWQKKINKFYLIASLAIAILLGSHGIYKIHSINNRIADVMVDGGGRPNWVTGGTGSETGGTDEYIRGGGTNPSTTTEITTYVGGYPINYKTGTIPDSKTLQLQGSVTNPPVNDTTEQPVQIDSLRDADVEVTGNNTPDRTTR